MKKILLYAALAFPATHTFAQNTWQATNLTNVTYLPVVGLESHNNNLYGTVFNGSTATLSRLNADNTSWTDITPGNMTTNARTPRFMQSVGGKRMYLSTVNSGVFSLLYYTTDDCSSFKLDTAGLPKYQTGTPLITSLQNYKSKVIAGLSSYGYFLKDTSETKWHKIDVPTALTSVDPVTCKNDSLFAYDNTGTHAFYYSADWGTTWILRTSPDLPSDLSASRLVADRVTGRLYASGTTTNNTVSVLYYSDNSGLNWTNADMSAYIKKNANNTAQVITSIYSNNNNLFISLENNKDNTRPDIISSSNGLAGLAYDTLGLPKSAGGVNGVKFLVHKGKMVLSLNVIDVFIKGGSATGIAFVNGFENKISVYPNPAENYLYLNTNDNISSVKIVDLTGKLVLSSALTGNELDLSDLPEGMYFAQFYKAGQLISVNKIIKN